MSESSYFSNDYELSTNPYLSRGLIWVKFNQKRTYPDTKNKNFNIFFTPFPPTTYELYPPQAESIFGTNLHVPPIMEQAFFVPAPTNRGILEKLIRLALNR